MSHSLPLFLFLRGQSHPFVIDLPVRKPVALRLEASRGLLPRDVVSVHFLRGPRRYPHNALRVQVHLGCFAEEILLICFFWHGLDALSVHGIIRPLHREVGIDSLARWPPFFLRSAAVQVELAFVAPRNEFVLRLGSFTEDGLAPLETSR